MSTLEWILFGILLFVVVGIFGTMIVTKKFVYEGLFFIFVVFMCSIDGGKASLFLRRKKTLLVFFFFCFNRFAVRVKSRSDFFFSFLIFSVSFSFFPVVSVVESSFKTKTCKILLNSHNINRHQQ